MQSLDDQVGLVRKLPEQKLQDDGPEGTRENGHTGMGSLSILSGRVKVQESRHRRILPFGGRPLLTLYPQMLQFNELVDDLPLYISL